MATARRVPANEVVSTYDSAGGQDYTTLSAWEVDTDTNLVSADAGETLECFNGPHTDGGVTVGGGTADATRFRVLRPRAADMHSGTEATAVQFTNTTAAFIIRHSSEFFSLQDVSCTLSLNASQNRSVIAKTGGATNHDNVGVFIQDATNSGSGICRAFNAQTTCRLCITNGTEDDGFRNLILGQNCTSYGNGDAGFSDCTTLTNCVATFNTGSDFTGITTPTFIFSGDGTASGTGSVAYSDDNAFTFVDAGSDDYHLDAADTGAKDLGTDLSGTFDDDIDFETIVTFSGGFDSFPVAGGAQVWRSPIRHMSHLINR